MTAQPYVLPLQVRYGETDQMGVVHHASFILYLEEARTRFMEERGHSYAELERSGIGLPVRSLSISYRSAARFGDELAVEVWVERLKKASVTFGYVVRCSPDERVVVTAEVELACAKLSQEELKVCALPEALCEALRGA
jgi:acyl-CoA thioester hydrolase